MDDHLGRVTRGSPLIFTIHPLLVFKLSFHTVTLKVFGYFVLILSFESDQNQKVYFFTAGVKVIYF